MSGTTFVGCIALLLRIDRAQDTFEYVLVIGIVVVLVATGLFAFDGIVAGVASAICPSVNTADLAANCINN